MKRLLLFSSAGVDPYGSTIVAGVASAGSPRAVVALVAVALPAAHVTAGSAGSLAGFFGMGPAAAEAIPGSAGCVAPVAYCCYRIQSCNGRGDKLPHATYRGS